MVEADEVEGIEFKWGKKRGVGGKKKDVQFYESFTYDGVGYALYDSVYLYDESEAEPYIGKLIKIWENPNKTKKVKVLWFFRPCEISKYLNGVRTSENELFLASGEGKGLANINPLEAVAGKCNVVCISRDSRNPQPSDEELHMADFVFYRMFHVEKCNILEKMDEKIAGIEVKFLLNKVDSQKPIGVSKLDLDKKEVGGCAEAIAETVLLSGKKTQLECETVKADGNPVDTSKKENADSKVLTIKQKSSSGEKHACCVGGESTEMAITDRNIAINKFTSKSRVKENADSKVSLVQQKPSLGEMPASSMAAQSGEVAKINDQQGNISGDRICSKSKVNEIADKKPLLVKQKSFLEEMSSPSLSVKLGEMAKSNRPENISNDKFTLRSKDNSIMSEDKVGKVLDNHAQVEEKVKATMDPGELDDRPSKKAKLDGSVRASDDKNKQSVQNCNHGCGDVDAKGNVCTATASEDKFKHELKVDTDPHGTGNENSKKPKPYEKLTKHANGKLPKASTSRGSNEGSKTDNQMSEATRRPEPDKSKWFKGLPWEERMKTAHEQGTLVLLQNLDPSCTSAEVEGIILDAFKERCTAQMIQPTAFSSPHSGQAFVIFKTRKAAEMAVTKLDEGCLLLSSGRPLVGTIATPCFPRKQSTFFGHLIIDKRKHQMQREMRQAVSTSHCSQPNTIEYDMAMEWCLLQERSDVEWKKLYRQQGEELRRLKGTLKSK